MESELLAYLLDGLDDAESRQVEEQLERSAELRLQLTRLRGLVQPLAYDDAVADPPPLLYLHTLEKVAQVRINGGHRAVAPPVNAGERLPARPWYRRANVLVAAAAVFVVGMFTPVALLKVRREAGITECQNNLKEHYLAIRNYQTDNAGYFPKVDETGPLSRAGAYAVKLQDAGYWREPMRINCPGKNGSGVKPLTKADVVRLAATPGNEQWATQLSGCYAAPLGYYEGEGAQRHVEQVHASLGNEIPILADRPPRAGDGCDLMKENSPNHGYTGQNVLFQGGHVKFFTHRGCKEGKVNDTDLYRNANLQYAPGLSPLDAVLAPSEVPLPSRVTPTSSPE